MSGRTSLEPAVLVIFGITGDLSKRKLLPALYELIKADLVPEPFEIIGITRRPINLDELLEDVELCINERDKVCDPAVVAKLKHSIHLFQMDLTQPDDYVRLLEHINEREEQHKVCMNRLYYLSIPPQIFGPIVRLLGAEGHSGSCQHNTAQTRLLVEKPFGYDYYSAQELIEELRKSYSDDQIFRIDHYLAKETVQNILTFRFKNPVFSSIWDNRHISSILIEARETIGIEDRVAFFEQTGALRDLIQSHLLQLLALVTMEQPADMSSDALHAAKLAALTAIVPIPPDQVAAISRRGQYEGYRTEVNHNRSFTETFAEISLEINNRRWSGVPIVLRTGKALDRKETAITVTFVEPEKPQVNNQLTMRIQPNEGITLCLQAKKPGLTHDTHEVTMKFDYQAAFAEVHPDAYERVLVDAVRGDKTLFASSDEVLASWRVLQHVIEEWAKNEDGLQFYHQGSAGPMKNL